MAAKIIKLKKETKKKQEKTEYISEKKAAENYFKIPNCLIELCKTNPIVSHVLNEYCHKYDLSKEKYFREMLIVCIKELCRNDFYDRGKELLGDDDDSRCISFNKKDRPDRR